MRYIALICVLLPIFLCVAVIGSVAVVAAETSRVETCSFGQNLYAGVRSFEVRCLQRFLNASGFMVAADGAGSSGFETDYYGVRTMHAVALWQRTMGVVPAQGFFGPRSRAAYQILAYQTGPAPSTSSLSSALVPLSISSVTPDHITDGDIIVIKGSGFTADGNLIRYSIDPPGFAGRAASSDGASMSVRIDTAIREKIRGQIAGLPQMAQSELKAHFAKSISAQYGIAAAAGVAYIPIDLTARNKNGVSAPFRIYVNVIP